MKSLFVSLCSFVFFLFHQTVSINRLPLWFGGLAVECVLEDGEVEQGRRRGTGEIENQYLVCSIIGFYVLWLLEKKKIRIRISILALSPYRCKPFERNLLI